MAQMKSILSTWAGNGMETSPAVRLRPRRSSRRRSWLTGSLDLHGSTQTSFPMGHQMCAGVKTCLEYRTPVSHRYSLERGTPQFNISGWTALGGATAIRDYLDPQLQMVGNAGWTKGAHNVKFGVDIHRLHMNHNETQNPTFNFTGGLNLVKRWRITQQLQRNGRFPVGVAQRSIGHGHESARGHVRSRSAAACHASQLGGGVLRPRPVPADAENDRVGRPSLGVLPDAGALRPWSGGV